jgi:ribonuclease D
MSVQDSLVQRLGTLNRLGWLPDYASSLLDVSRFKPADPLLAWRRVFRRSRVQGIEAECVLRELAAWRERVSVKTNAIPSFVARDDMLVAMSMFATQHALAHAASQPPAPSASVDSTPQGAQTAAAKLQTIRLKEPMQLLSGLKRIQGWLACIVIIWTTC